MLRLTRTIFTLGVLSAYAVHAEAQTINSNIVNETPTSRYTLHGNNTVTDTTTGLMWQQCSLGLSGSDCSVGTATTHTWQEALQVAASDTTATHTDWRLPNAEELRSLLAYNRVNPSINTEIFPNTNASFFWSASLYAANGRFAWAIDFNDGFVNSKNRSVSQPVRLVRSGQ